MKGFGRGEKHSLEKRSWFFVQRLDGQSPGGSGASFDCRQQDEMNRYVSNHTAQLGEVGEGRRRLAAGDKLRTERAALGKQGLVK